MLTSFQNDPRVSVQCAEAIYGDQSRPFRRSHATVQATQDRVRTHAVCILPASDVCCRERQHAVARYEEWQKLREKAIKNCGGKLPEGYVDFEPTPPPPPVEDLDIMDLSIDLNAVSIDAEAPLGELDESGIERVPMADPGMDVRAVASQL